MVMTVSSGRGRGVAEFVTSWLGARKSWARTDGVHNTVGVSPKLSYSFRRAKTILCRDYSRCSGKTDRTKRRSSAFAGARPVSREEMGGGEPRRTAVKYYRRAAAGPFQSELNPVLVNRKKSLEHVDRGSTEPRVGAGKEETDRFPTGNVG